MLLLLFSMEVQLFRTQYSKPLHKYANSGSPIKIVYGSSLDKFGNIIVKEKGRENLADYINSFKESCDLNIILTKYLNGDNDVINQRKALFMDLTEMPTNYNDMMNKINDARELFDSMPVETKAKFDNDINKFFCNVGTDEWFEKLKIDKVVPNMVVDIDNNSGDKVMEVVNNE